MLGDHLRAARYLRPWNGDLARFILAELPFLDFPSTLAFYEAVTPSLDRDSAALLAANDRYYLFTAVMKRRDALHPWLFDRCREVEMAPDGHLDLWAREHYKLLSIDEPIPTPNGWVSHGSLDVGDKLFGPDGKVCRVVARTSVFPAPPMHRITFDDGFSILAGDDHLWEVEQRSKRRIPMAYKAGGPQRLYREKAVLSTLQIAQRDHQSDNRLAVRVNDPLDLPTAGLPVAAYTMGAWLGDGTSDAGAVTCGDREVFDSITAEGYELSEDRVPRRNAELRTVYGLTAELRRAGVFGRGQKHIPQAYLRASMKQRLSLLQGLMDTDGHCDTRGTATFCNTNEALVDGICELAHSLGLKPRRRFVTTTYKGEPYPVWQVSFQAYKALPPFRIPRKLARCKDGARPKPRRYIVSCERVEPVPGSCIQVDRPDGLYLAGRNMVTTHNSSIITFAGTVQEIVADPEITIGLFSHTRASAGKFLEQIMTELESNEDLKALFPDVLHENPRRDAMRWSLSDGIVVKRASNPKEATLEAHGLVQGQPTGRHFRLMVYDDIIDEKHVANPEQVQKATRAVEMSDNLGAGDDARKQFVGTRYSFSDTYGILLERGVVTARVYPATDDGKLTGNPVFMSRERLAEKIKLQRSTFAAQMLQNPLAGQENTFRVEWFRPYEVRPRTMNVYIMGDPSKGSNKKSDRTAIAVIGVDSSGNKYLLDGYRHRMSLSQRWVALRDLYKKWIRQPGVLFVKVGYERYGQQTDQEYFDERMEAEGAHFPIEELNWTKEGNQSKKDRVERLEPDFRNSRFFLPAQVHEVGLGKCMWGIQVEKQHVAVRKMEGLTRQMQLAMNQGEASRIAVPLVRRDEDGNLYDLTRALMEEMTFFPFAPKDDLVDAVSRIYDMEPLSPTLFAVVDERDVMDEAPYDA